MVAFRKSLTAGAKLSAAAYFAAGWCVRYIPRIGSFTASMYCLIVFAVSIGLQQLCFRQSFKRTLFNSSAAYILQNLALIVSELCAATVEGKGYILLVQIPITAAVYVLYYFLFARRKGAKAHKINSLVIVLISLFSVLVSNVFFSLIVTRGFSQEQILPVKFILLVCSNLALFFQFGVLVHAALSDEKAIVEQLLANEQKQHKISQENIDLINIKCHDLKKQLGLIRKCAENGDIETLISDAENAVSVYDESVDTGNANLDLVLTEKQLYCQKNNIRIELMTDGEKIGFLSPTDIYSLFGNALDNAIEGVLDLPEEARTISIEIRQKGRLLSVTVSNPCRSGIAFKEGFPLTSKSDEKFHGFGTRSMKYIVEKYGGNIVFTEKDDRFTVYILFPVKN